MTDGYLLTKYLHLLAFVYWLGADLGVFYAARLAARGDLATAERRRALRLALLLDMGPRTGLILVLPTGFTLTVLGGWLEYGTMVFGMRPLVVLAGVALMWWWPTRAPEEPGAPSFPPTVPASPDDGGDPDSQSACASLRFCEFSLAVDKRRFCHACFLGCRRRDQ